MYYIQPPPDVAIAEIDVRDAVSQDLLTRYEHDLKARLSPDFELGLCAPPALEDFDPPSGVFLVTTLAGEPVACGGLRTIGDGIGEIRRMYVDPVARGHGIGRHLLDSIEAFACEREMTVLRLDTTEELIEAQRLYERAGYQRIPDYNGNICAERWYEKHLT